MVAEIVVPGASSEADTLRVADHEGDRHGLAERSAEPQHHPADDADARVGASTLRTTSQVVQPMP